MFSFLRKAPSRRQISNPPVPASTEANPDQAASSAHLPVEEIARSSITLSKLAPVLAQLADELLEGARQQAERSHQIAEETKKMALSLETAMNGLDSSSRNVNQVVDTINEVADQTRIIAVNASIEAARAGHYGRAFGVVAHEVESLANQTKDSTDGIAHSMSSIQEDIKRVLQSAGLERKKGSVKRDADNFSIADLGGDMESIATIAHQHSSSAHAIHDTSEQIRGLCEELLMTVGTFRTASHERAKAAFKELAEDPGMATGDRATIERICRDALARHALFELVYMTDPHGRQITANLWSDFQRDGTASLGNDWHDRTWFREALHTDGIYVSDIYRSRATDNFCFTLAVKIPANDSSTIGVLAADINFAKLIEI